MPNIKLSKLVFLPLLALVTIDLAPMADAQRSSKRSSSSSSARRSSGGSSRQSGTRSSGSSSRGSSYGGTTRTTPAPAPRVTHRVAPAPTPRVTGTTSSSSSRQSGASGTTRRSGSSSSQPRVRYVAPTSGSSAPSYADSRQGRAATPAPSTKSGAGEFNAATPTPVRSRSPLPSTARDTTGSASVGSNGRTTYARRFDALGTSARAAAAERIRAENGIPLQSETSRDELSARYRKPTERSIGSTLGKSAADNATSGRTRVRSSNGPSSRYRAKLAEAASVEPQTRRSAWEDASPETKARLRHKYGESAGEPGIEISTKEGANAEARSRQKAWDNASPEGKARLRKVFDKKAEKQVLDSATIVSRASGEALAAATRLTLGAGGGRAIVSTFGGYDSGTGGSSFSGYTDYPGSGYGSGYGYWDSNGYYHSSSSSWYNWNFGWCTNWGFNFGFGWPYYGSSYYYSPVGWYYPSVSNYYDSNGSYGDGYQDGYASASYDDEPVVVNVYTEGPVGETVYVEAAPEAGVNIVVSQPAVSDAPLSAAALRYLELGDEAFGAGRFADAVHFYSRSIEFEPKRGMLHLVLADALFATGDYHYCAHSIRKALELEPALVSAPVDKHLFYAEPAEFDQQIAVLELYLADYKTDVDARLVLGLNYLFGERPQAAVELLESGPNTSAAFGGNAATLILESAKLHQYGDQVPPDAAWE